VRSHEAKHKLTPTPIYITSNPELLKLAENVLMDVDEVYTLPKPLNDGKIIDFLEHATELKAKIAEQRTREKDFGAIRKEKLGVTNQTHNDYPAESISTT